MTRAIVVKISFAGIVMTKYLPAQRIKTVIRVQNPKVPRNKIWPAFISVDGFNE